MTQDLQAGAAAVTITPPLDISVAGSYGDRRADGLITDLYARALVLDDGGCTVAIVTLDLVGLDPAIAARACARAEALTGIPAERILLTCTHTHSGPATYSQPWCVADPGYLDLLPRSIGDAVALANQRRREAHLLVGRGTEATLAFNRRYWMRDGTLRTNPGLQNPDIVRPAGPIDPEVSILRVEDTTGRAIAILVNYALHTAVVGATRYSADFPGVLSTLLQRIEGPQTVVLFANGCCGDINHLNISKPGPQSGQAEAERIGAILAGEVLKVGARLAPVDSAPRIVLRSAEIELPLRVPTADELAWALPRSPFPMHTMDAAGLENVAAHRMWWIHQQGRTTVTLTIQVLAVGDAAYVTLPAEIFVELGLAIKAHSPFHYTLIGMLNSSAIDYYIPTEKAYAEGGYEAVNSPIQPGGGERIVEEVLNLLRDVRA